MERNCVSDVEVRAIGRMQAVLRSSQDDSVIV